MIWSQRMNQWNAFIAYLWGIETKYAKFYLTIFSFVYRVPMRNWNLYHNHLNHLHRLSLSRTYEELKHVIKSFDWRNKISLSRTYEELKQYFLYWDLYLEIGLSRTYEELKLKYFSYKRISFYPFIAYLWGIETLYVRRSLKMRLSVYRVPMRNWNNL